MLLTTNFLLMKLRDASYKILKHIMFYFILVFCVTGVPECPLLIVNNAVVVGGSTRVNSIRNITCNVGFELSGNSLVTCLPSGKWTTLPVCNRKYLLFKCVRNTHVSYFLSRKYFRPENSCCSARLG